ncbi:MAG: hypothetical protein BHW64_00310 [Candidatus Melainabacteria bacterium LEY3_CP_29_8]|nr:MAG: hypothetical protein BHW64_00310 [Candidatus Melainabacteria bacterium LEY3_CP_29_8]
MENDLTRVMALDIGTKRIGVALSDPLKLFASQKFLVLNSNNPENAVNDIIQIAQDNNVSKIVFGLPCHMNGDEGEMVKYVREFAQHFNNYSYIIDFIDERLTSSQAEDILKKKKVKYSKNKGLVDQTSACLILESYLNQYGKGNK